MPFRFLHLADLHLETRFGGSEATRARLREATLEAFGAAVDLALERELDAVLIAGDTFDDPLLSRRTELAFVRGLRRLAEGGTDVVIACGNHDPGGGDKRMSALGLDHGEDWRERIHLLKSARPRVLRLTGRDGREVGVVVGAGHSSENEQRNLAERFPPVEADVPVVGLLHTQVHSARGSAEHAPYAPSTRDDLERLGYDYLALGHVHLRQRPFEDLPAWYAGNLQGRNSRERGEKGGLLVELYPGEPATPEFVSLAPVLWDKLRVEDLGACCTAQDLLEHLTAVVRDQVATSPDHEVVLVLELVGTSRAASALREPDDRRAFEEDVAEAGGALEVQLRADGLRPLRDLDAVRSVPSVVGQALELLELARTDSGVLAELLPEHLAGVDDADPAEYLRTLLDGLQEELLDRALEDPA
jgi:exonuclease SbcD